MENLILKFKHYNEFYASDYEKCTIFFPTDNPLFTKWVLVYDKRYNQLYFSLVMRSCWSNWTDKYTGNDYNKEYKKLYGMYVGEICYDKRKRGVGVDTLLELDMDVSELNVVELLMEVDNNDQ